jgi:hypothetical protein
MKAIPGKTSGTPTIPNKPSLLLPRHTKPASTIDIEYKKSKSIVPATTEWCFFCFEFNIDEKDNPFCPFDGNVAADCELSVRQQPQQGCHQDATPLFL